MASLEHLNTRMFYHVCELRDQDGSFYSRGRVGEHKTRVWPIDDPLGDGILVPSIDLLNYRDLPTPVRIAPAK
jgi:hypothetical protein